LSVPALTADYNDKMGGVDIADQCRTYYATQLRVARNWMPLFFWLFDTTIINAYIIAYEQHTTHPAYKKNCRWKWHENLAWELVLEGFYELNPQHAQHEAMGSNNIPTRSSHSNSCITPSGNMKATGNTKASRQKGYVSKYYELPMCRKQPGNHTLKHASKE
ncbi:hypothetical protein L873DRAFT_1680099, partial [Choiromyces venosus 120613-1]